MRMSTTRVVLVRRLERLLLWAFRRPARAFGLVAAVGAVVLGTLGLAWGAAGIVGGILVLNLTGIVVLSIGVLLLARRVQGRLDDDVDEGDTRRDDLHTKLSDLERRVTTIATREADRQLAVARRAVEDGDVEAAVEAYENALAWAPQRRKARDEHLAAVERLHAGDDPARGFARVADRQLRAGSDDHARALVDRGLELAPKSLGLRERRVALLANEGDHTRALDLALEAAEQRVQRLQAQRPSEAAKRPLTTSGRIAIAGFYYSGSGAVKDHLRGFARVDVWPPVGELRIIKFPGGFADLGRRLQLRGQLRAKDLVDHYLHLIGRKLTSTPPGVYDKWEVVNANSRRLLRRSEETAGYLEVCLTSFLTLVEEALDSQLDEESLSAHSRAWLARALDAAATDIGVDHLVIDQVVTGWRLELARYLPPSSFVLVHRDPRDQFAEVREVIKQPGRSSRRRSPRQFAKSYRAHQLQAAEQIPWLEQRLGHRVLRVSFEDFVLDHEVQAARIQEFVGLQEREPSERRFDPAVSRRNVGKHVAMVSKEEVHLLGELLREYLHPGCEPV